MIAKSEAITPSAGIVAGLTDGVRDWVVVVVESVLFVVTVEVWRFVVELCWDSVVTEDSLSFEISVVVAVLLNLSGPPADPDSDEENSYNTGNSS